MINSPDRSSAGIVDALAKTIWLAGFERAFSRMPTDPWENQAESAKAPHINTARKIIEAGFIPAAQPTSTREAFERVLDEHEFWLDQHPATRAEILNRLLAAQPPTAPVETKSQAKEPEASGGLCAVAPHAVRVGVASADLPATSEKMDVTAGETAPHFPSSADNGVAKDRVRHIVRNLASVNMTEDVAERQARRITDALEAAGLIADQPQTAPDREKVARAIHDGLGGDEWNDKRADLLNAADAVLALMPSQPQEARAAEIVGPFNADMPSSLNDACRRLDLAQERIAQLEALVEPKAPVIRCPCGLREMGSCPLCRKPPQQSQQVKAPDGYTKLPAGLICKCFKMWRDGNGEHWCCTPPLSRPHGERE